MADPVLDQGPGAQTQRIQTPVSHFGNQKASTEAKDIRMLFFFWIIYYNV